MILPVVDENFRAARLVPQAAPTRLQVNLGERCNLRCVHCITDAPQKTKDETARVLSDEVLARLAPHLRHAHYVGLTHAGEPIMQPQFRPLLQELRARRSGEPTVVHLLSNGLLMTPERLVEVAGLGVCSLSISLDGIFPQSNDTVRIGSHIDVLLPRVAALVAARAQHQLDVRLGVSTVCTQKNVGELTALARALVAAGIDWWKLEEIYPHNDIAAALVIDRHTLDVAIAAAVDVGTRGGLKVLDHTRELEIWKCQLADHPRMKRRSQLDDFANRVEINPCRLPWELCCIEPDGDVKPMSFHHPVAGNLLNEDLATIWSGPVFQQARQDASRRRLCGAGPVGCSADSGPLSW